MFKVNGTKTMVRMLFVLLCILVVVGCGNNSTQEANSNPQQESRSPVDTNSSNSSSSDIEEVKIVISHVSSENTPKHYGLSAMKEYLENESGGRISVEIHANSVLFNDNEEVDNLIANNIQFIVRDMAKLVGHDPVYNLPSIPFLFDSQDHMLEFWKTDTGRSIMGRLEKDGMLGLDIWPGGFKNLTNSVRPVHLPEDVTGLKIRTQGGQALEETFAQLGANSVTLPFTETILALQQKTVDGMENYFSILDGRKIDDVQDYMTVNLNHSRIDFIVLTNTTFWNSLNEATQEMILKGLEVGTKEAINSNDEIESQAYQNLIDRGKIEIHEITDVERDAFRKALQPVVDKFEDIIGTDVYETIESVK